MQNGMSLDSLPRLVQSYNDNLAYLNSIKFNGGTSFNINIELGNGNVNFESNEYLLSFINYAQIISNAITPAKNVSQLLQAIGTTQLVAAMNYLLDNAPITKEVMMANALKLMISGGYMMRNGALTPERMQTQQKSNRSNSK